MKQLGVVLAIGFGLVAGAGAQQFKPGDKVAGSYTSADWGWHNGCTFVSGPHPENNNYSQVKCDGTTYWVGPKWVRADGTAAVKAVAQPVGSAAPPTVTARARTTAAATTAAAPRTKAQAETNAAATNATGLKPGKYSCYAGNPEHYLFMDVNIRSASTYTDVEGKSGNYSFDPATQRVTFSSGSFEGTYAKLLPHDTIGMASKPNSFFATTCQLTK